jgi:hypothetical protein
MWTVKTKIKTKHIISNNKTEGEGKPETLFFFYPMELFAKRTCFSFLPKKNFRKRIRGT